jgi:hypothetical protein
VSVSLSYAGEEQMSLLDISPCGPIKSNAHARNAYGSVAQEVACAALGLRAIPINGAKTTCFDAQDDERFYEIKSVRKGGKLVIYDWRMQKERDAGVPLYYAIVVHNARGARSFENLVQALSEGVEIVVVEASKVHLSANKQPLCKLKRDSNNPRAGYNRKGYKDGYRNVPLRDVMPERAEQCPCFIFGREFKITLRTEL